MFCKFIRSIECLYGRFQSDQYQEWKKQEYSQDLDLIQYPVQLLSFLAILIRLAITTHGSELYIQLGINIASHLVMLLLIMKGRGCKLYIIEIVPILQQVLLNWYCIYFYKQNVQFLLIIAAGNIMELHLIYSILFKLISIGITITTFMVVIEERSSECIIIYIVMLLFHVMKREAHMISFYNKLQSLFLIIDSIPSAMCIVKKNKSQLLYSNKNFENLALTLEGTSSSETDQSPQKFMNYSKLQLHFLSNLELKELNTQGISIVDFEDELMDEQYRIKKVIYQKEEESPEFGSRKIIYKLNDDERLDVDQKTQYQKEFFHSFRQKDDDHIQRKQYTCDIVVQVELRHQPYTCMQQAKRKQLRKRSSNKISINRASTPTSGKVSFDGLLKDNGKQNIPQVTPTLNHKMKMLVHVIDNYKIFDQDDDLQIFFIHELNPVLLKTSLKKLESVKKNLLRSISHELLTNLNAAYGYIKQCQDRLLKQEPMSEQLACALRYTKLQLLKVQDFFDYRYLLDDKLKLRQDKFELINAIMECVELIKDQIFRKQLSYKLDIPENCAFIVEGDRQRFCQVILNLLTNAIKFTYQGGITVEVKKKSYSPSCFGIIDEVCSQSFGDNQNILEIHIRDSGVGMDEEELVTLRKKLHVADEDEKVSKQSVGIGLGLSVCKSIISQLAPSNSNLLFVESVKDSGTQFYFCMKYLEERSSLQKSQQLTIPNQDAQSASVKVLDYNKGHQTNTLKNIKIPFRRGYSQELSIEIPKRNNQCYCQTILIVDDEQFNLDIISHIVGQMGFQIETAMNGKQAIEKVSEKLSSKCSGKCTGYYCILMDINMPIMSGWEAVQIIRQMECQLQITRTIPVIAVTAFCSISDQEKSINEGFDGVIIKPATREKLRNTFENLNL